MVVPTNRSEHAGTCSRQLHAQTLTVAFKKQWNLLAETTVAVQSTARLFLKDGGKDDPRLLK
jgi:hypothetical protein